MNILIIPSAYPTNDHKIRGSFFKEQALALKKDGNNVGVIYSETRRVTGIRFKSFKINHFQKSISDEDGIITVRMHGWNVLSMRNSLGKALWIKQMVKLYEKYVKIAGTPDIIHVHCGLYGGAVAKIIKDKYHVPYVITEHDSNILNHHVNSSDSKLLKEAYDCADKLLAVGNRLKNSMKSYTKNEICVVPNIVNTEQFYPVNDCKSDKFKFISVSYLKPGKNVSLTIKAFSELIKCRENVELIIVGDGEEETSLKELAQKLKIDNNVKFLGRQSRVNTSQILRECDAFVLPSNFETFGVAYIEALASGIPIIATRCGGPEDFFEDSLGYIINKNDLSALKDAMDKIIINKDNFNKKYLSEFVENKFGEKVIVNKLMEIYKAILK